MKNYSDEKYSLEECKKEFIDYLTSVKREGMDQLTKYLEDTDFFTAPASVNKNESREGGLIRHSLNVMTRMLLDLGSEGVLNAGNAENAAHDIDSVTIVALLSGIWKANYYKPARRKVTKEDGTVEYLPIYKVRPPEERLCYGNDQDHGDEAVYIIQGFIRLKRAEAFAIRSQEWNPRGEEARRVFNKNSLALMLHVAELKAMYLDEIEV